MAEQNVIWRPTIAGSHLGAFLAELAEQGLSFDGYDDLWAWSVSDADGFWRAAWQHFGLPATDGPALARDEMPGARWFPGAAVNYATECLRAPGGTAVVAYSQSRPEQRLTYEQLRDHVARARAGLLRLGVRRGDRVVGYLPNIPEAVIAFLATAGIGAVWSVCAPELGAAAAAARLAQLEPSVLIAVGGYRYGEKTIDRRREVDALRRQLPTLRAVVDVPLVGEPLGDTVSWTELLAEPAEFAGEAVPFDHPLCVLFSSGTTGVPKAITHGHGGLLIEHHKCNAFSFDLGADGVFQWFSTTSWMVWNSLVSGLLRGSTIVLVDGDPMRPDPAWQWRIAGATGATVLGVSPGYLRSCRRLGIRPREIADLTALRQVMVAGSPLDDDGYRWLVDELGPGVFVNVGSGGTDVCSALLQGSPASTVRVGEIPAAALGVAAEVWDADGTPTDGVGELVITRPLPSMPVGFWGDDGRRLEETYFSMFPGVWRHGDWVRRTPHGGWVVEGRSDSTLNRGGVRLGTGEFYSALESLDGVEDSLVVHLEDRDGGNGRLVLLVSLSGAGELDDVLRARIVRTLRETLSPRHVPDEIIRVRAIPRNRTGKKLEVPVKRLLQGARLDEVVSPGSVEDIGLLEELAAR